MFPSGGFQPTPSPNNLDDSAALIPEAMELFEPDFLTFGSGSMLPQSSVNGISGTNDLRGGRSHSAHRFPFLDPHQSFTGASAGRPGPNRSPPTSDVERLHESQHNAQQLSDVTGMKFPYPPLSSSHPAQDVNYYMSNRQGYGTEWPVTSASSIQPPVHTNSGMSGFFPANNDAITAPDSRSHNDHFHQVFDNGGIQPDWSQQAFFPSEEILRSTISDDMTTTNSALYNSQAAELSDNTQRPNQKTRKARAKKVKATIWFDASSEAVDEEHKFPEPDATYAFDVTDWDDVYLDPKPTESFGTHEPHLAKKVANVAKRLRSEKKAAPERTLVTMAALHTAIQARAMSLMSRSGPRPQTSKATRRKQWDAPSNDPSIPTTAVAYAVCLRLLVNAILNRNDCMESENAEFRNRYHATSTYYSEEAVYKLARQILDELIDVHENGFWHETLDPDYDERYRKTQDFNFRDRFNLVTRILKHSKSTCNELFKNFRLHDVIGGAYDLEVRVWSNFKNNKAKSEKEKKRRRDDVLKATEAETSESTTTQKPPRKILPVKSDTVATVSTGQSSSSSATTSVTNNDTDATKVPAAIPATTYNAQPAKRRIEDDDDETESHPAPAKKLKTSSRPKAMQKIKATIKSSMKGKAKATAAVAEDDSEDEFRAPAARRKTGGKADSSGPAPRRSRRTATSAVDPPAT